MGFLENYHNFCRFDGFFFMRMEEIALFRCIARDTGDDSFCFISSAKQWKKRARNRRIG